MKKLLLYLSDGTIHFGKIGIYRIDSIEENYTSEGLNKFIYFSKNCAFIKLYFSEKKDIYPYHSIVKVSEVTEEEYKQILRDKKLEKIIR